MSCVLTEKPHTRTIAVKSKVASMAKKKQSKEKSQQPTDTLRILLRNAKKIPQLPEPEKNQLIKQYQDSGFTDNKALTKLILGDLNIILSIAYRFNLKKLGIEDLFQAGVLGYIRAVQLYEPNKGSKLTTYATPWIKQAMARHLCAAGDTVSLPVGKSGKISKVRREFLKRSLTNESHDTRSLADAVGISEKVCSEIKEILHVFNCDSLDRKVASEDDGEVFVGNAIACTKALDFEDEIAVSEDRKQLDALLDKLGDSQDLTGKQKRSFIQQRFGLIDGERKSLCYLAYLFRISESRASRLEKEILLELWHKADADKFNASFTGEPVYDFEKDRRCKKTYKDPLQN